MAALTFVTTSAFAQPDAGSGDSWEGVQRFLQYEAVMGHEMPAETAFCVDDRLGGAWRLDETLIVDDLAWFQLSEKVRSAAEECTSAQHDGDLRFVREIASALQTIRDKRVAQEQTGSARQCLAKSPNLPSLRSCLTNAMQQEPPDADWKRWTTLYRQRRQQ